MSQHAVTTARGPLYAVGAVSLLPSLAGGCGLVVVGSPSWESTLFGVGWLGVAVGGLLSPRLEQLRWLVGGLLLVMLGLVVQRLVATGSGRTLQAPSNRLTDRLIPERDIALGGSNLLIINGFMGDEEGLVPALKDGYTRMRQDQGAVPSPVLSTLLFGQSARDHSVLVVAGEPQREHAAVVFLHGSMGNVTLLCWQVSRAAAPLGIATTCPSAGTRAQWATEHVETVRTTIATARRRGARRVILAGLSAGGIAASVLAPDLDIDGLVLISGVAGAAQAAKVPTLVIQGGKDPRTPAAPARAYARRGGDKVTYFEHADAAHWLILSHHELVRSQLESWLRRHAL